MDRNVALHTHAGKKMTIRRSAEEIQRTSAITVESKAQVG